MRSFLADGGPRVARSILRGVLFLVMGVLSHSTVHVFGRPVAITEGGLIR